MKFGDVIVMLLGFCSFIAGTVFLFVAFHNLDIAFNGVYLQKEGLIVLGKGEVLVDNGRTMEEWHQIGSIQLLLAFEIWR